MTFVTPHKTIVCSGIMESASLFVCLSGRLSAVRLSILSQNIIYVANSSYSFTAIVLKHGGYIDHVVMCKTQFLTIYSLLFKSGYLGFSHLTELKNIYFFFITEIYMKKQYKSSIAKNHKIKKIYIFLMVFP